MNAKQTVKPRWEYTTTLINAEEEWSPMQEEDARAITQILNQYGAQGWELTSLEKLASGQFFAVFKRRFVATEQLDATAVE